MESCRTFCLKRSGDFLSKRDTANLRQSCWKGTTCINTSFSLLPLSSLHLGSSLAVLNLQLKIELICVIHTVQLPSQRSWWMQECVSQLESEGTTHTSASNCILGRGFSKLPSALIVCQEDSHNLLEALILAVMVYYREKILIKIGPRMKRIEQRLRKYKRKASIILSLGSHIMTRYFPGTSV